MQAKSVMYAAVGAPVVAARKASEQVSHLKAKWNEERADYTKAAELKISTWAAEGEKVVSRISDGKVVEEISSKVDLDQAKVQVTKLRDQLEDMLATWKSSFRPADKPLVKTEVKEAVKTAPKTADKTATKAATPKAPAKATTSKASAAKTTKSSTTAKTSPAKPATAS